MPPKLPAQIDTGSCSGREPSAAVRKSQPLRASGNALAAYLTKSQIPGGEMRKTAQEFGPDKGMFCTWGLLLLITCQHHMATLGAVTGDWGARVSFNTLIQVCRDARMLCSEDRRQRGAVPHLLVMSLTRLKSSLQDCPGHLPVSQQNVPGHYICKHIGCFRTS